MFHRVPNMLQIPVVIFLNFEQVMIKKCDLNLFLDNITSSSPPLFNLNITMYIQTNL